MAEASQYGSLKLLLLLVALLLALSLVQGPIVIGTVERWLLVYAAASTLGAFLGPSSAASLLRSGRFAITVVAVAALGAALAQRAEGIGASLVRVVPRVALPLAVLALVGSMAGVSRWEITRLGGWIPPLHPNALAGLVAAGAVICVNIWARGGRQRMLLQFLLFAATLGFTGSRSALMGTVVGLIVSLWARKPTTRGAVITWLTIVLLLMGLLAPGVINLGALVTRGDKGEIDLTLTGRTYAWQSAAELNVSVAESLFGQGLAVKTVPVNRGYIRVQNLDGTWHSAYVQAGFVGAAALLAACVSLLRRIWRRSGGLDTAILLGVFLLLVIQSVLESSLNDVSMPFLLLSGVAADARSE